MWDEAFSSYTFTDRAKEVMKFFHIHYECNDARDDFYAQRKRLEKGMKLPQTYSEEDLDEMDTRYYIDDDELPIREKEAKALDAVHTPDGMATQIMERI